MVRNVYGLAVPRLLANVAKLTRVLIDACCIHSSLVIMWVIGPNLTKFVPDVEGSLPMFMRPSALRLSNLFQNASAINESVVGHFRHSKYKIQDPKGPLKCDKNSSRT